MLPSRFWEKKKKEKIKNKEGKHKYFEGERIGSNVSKVTSILKAFIEILSIISFWNTSSKIENLRSQTCRTARENQEETGANRLINSSKSSFLKSGKSHDKGSETLVQRQ